MAFSRNKRAACVAGVWDTGRGRAGWWWALLDGLTGAFHPVKGGSLVGPSTERVSCLFLVQENLLYFTIGTGRFQ